MVSCELMGGLGNQMFQIAATIDLAIENNDIYCFDFKSHDIINQGFKAVRYIDNVYHKLPNNICGDFDYVYKEDNFRFNRIDYRNNMKLIGYFQSEKYFINNKNVIIDLFKNETILNKLYDLYGDLLNDSVSLHFRRGDYIKYQHTHPIQDLAYYSEAIKYLEENTKIKNIFIFSDEIEYSKKIDLEYNLIFVEGLHDYEQLYLMSMCKHNIIANSSFSWWGSYLNENKNKIVISPKNWFTYTSGIDWSDIYSNNMIIL